MQNCYLFLFVVQPPKFQIAFLAKRKEDLRLGKVLEDFYGVAVHRKPTVHLFKVPNVHKHDWALAKSEDEEFLVGVLVQTGLVVEQLMLLLLENLGVKGANLSPAASLD